MYDFPPTIIWRHRKENLKKCSLRGLEKRADLRFYKYPTQELPPLEGYLLLAVDAPVLTREDAESGLVLLDGTWRYVEKMAGQLPPMKKRSLPPVPTAYPRRQDEERGLASVEALFLAHHILGRPTEGLLDHYLWKDKFYLAYQNFRQ